MEKSKPVGEWDADVDDRHVTNQGKTGHPLIGARLHEKARLPHAKVFASAIVTVTVETEKNEWSDTQPVSIRERPREAHHRRRNAVRSAHEGTDRPPSDATGTDLLSVGTVKEVLHSDATGMDHLSVGIVKGGLLLDATGMDLPTDVTGKARLMDATGRVLHLAVANALNVGIAGITVIDIPIKNRPKNGQN